MSHPAQAGPRQGDVLISHPFPLTGGRKLCTVVSADIYNAATAYATETDYGVVLTDRLVATVLRSHQHGSRRFGRG